MPVMENPISRQKDELYSETLVLSQIHDSMLLPANDRKPSRIHTPGLIFCCW